MILFHFVINNFVGAITGPIGSGTSGLAKGASGLVKLGARAGAKAAAGTKIFQKFSANGKIEKAMRGKDIYLGSYAKAIEIGEGKFSKGQLEAASKVVDSLKSKVIKENLKKTNEFNKVQSSIQELTIHRETLMKINENSDLSDQQKDQARSLYCKENNLNDKKALKNINRNLISLEVKSEKLRSKLMDDKNVQSFHGDRADLIAVDLAPPDAEIGQRSGERAIFEVHDGKAVYADHTPDHNYDDCKKNVSNVILDPSEALHPEQLNQEPHLNIRQAITAAATDGVANEAKTWKFTKVFKLLPTFIWKYLLKEKKLIHKLTYFTFTNLFLYQLLC